jgi:hypothetical protein
MRVRDKPAVDDVGMNEERGVSHIAYEERKQKSRDNPAAPPVFVH